VRILEVKVEIGGGRGVEVASLNKSKENWLGVPLWLELVTVRASFSPASAHQEELLSRARARFASILPQKYLNIS
jgi:hypothetical protein